MSAYTVVGDTVAVSQHPQCGLFTSNKSEHNDSRSIALGRQYYSDIARESRQYAKSCYDPARGTNNDPNPDSCSFFYNPRIEYTVLDNDGCPFRTPNFHMCLNGENSAYSVATGSASTTWTVDASTIGINSPLKYKFHRSITCSPLKTEPFIVSYATNDTLMNIYLYGNNTGDSRCTLPDITYCTFEIPVQGPTSEFRTYGMHTVSTSRFSNIPETWHAFFEVNKTLGEIATLILISNNYIFSPRQILDPIFFANSTNDGGWYFNGAFRASVLGCMSRTLVCLPNKVLGPCYSLENLGNLEDTDFEHTSVRSMLYFSLLLDLQLDSLLGDALDAQSLLMGCDSDDISDEQWKLEVRQIFESLLARTQINARNIARGVPGIKRPHEQNIMRPEYQGMCTRYKFRTVGWSNISMGHFLVQFLLGLTICILGITRENKELWFEEPMKRMAKTRLGGICVSAVMHVVGLASVCVSAVWRGVRWMAALRWPRNRRVRRRLP